MCVPVVYFGAQRDSDEQPLDGGNHSVEHLAAVASAEARDLAQARAAFEANPDDIACFIAEPIQGGGGDNHMRAEFLQAMQALWHEYDALFVLDEVQPGVGADRHGMGLPAVGLQPDIVALAKKAQVGGIMAGRRVDEVGDNVFTVSGRINSTWGGGLVDMVRARRVLEIIEREDLVEHAVRVGEWFLGELQTLAARHPGVTTNVRGRGLMCAFDVSNGRARGDAIRRLQEEHVLALGCGERSIRFRPALNVTKAELSFGLLSSTACSPEDAPRRITSGCQLASGG